MGWYGLAKDRDRWRALVNMVRRSSKVAVEVVVSRIKLSSIQLVRFRVLGAVRAKNLLVVHPGSGAQPDS
jgi:hypothetical protein